MNLTIVLVLLALVAVALAQDPECDMNMSGKKCAAEEVFPACLAPSLNWENCVCPPGTRCHLMENDACAYSCETVGDEVDDNNAGMGPGNGMD